MQLGAVNTCSGDGVLATNTGKKRPSKSTVAKKPLPAPKARVPNAATLRALADLKAGKVTQYVDADDLFRKLDVKDGKA
jgi:hypothetical protein